MRLASPAAKLLALAALPLALAACGSGAAKTSTQAAPATAPATASATGTASGQAGGGSTEKATPAEPNAGLRTGTQLKAALAPAGFFPAGFTLDAAGSRDTGDMYVQPSTAEVPTPDCTKLGGTSWTDITGIAGVSFAQNDYVDKNASAEISQEIDVYRGDTAKTVVGALGKVSTVCKTFQDTQTSSAAKVAEEPTAGLGDEAYTITLTDAAWQNGETLIAARAGTSVVTVLANDGSDNGAATAHKLVAQLLTGLKAKV